MALFGYMPFSEAGSLFERSVHKLSQFFYQAYLHIQVTDRRIVYQQHNKVSQHAQFGLFFMISSA